LKLETTLSQRIGIAIVLSGDNKSQIAHKIGINPVSLSRWLKGPTEPSISDAKSIAKACKVNSQWILTGEGDIR
jgi:transcriptional regulator with XRE-family HTH domain